MIKVQRDSVEIPEILRSPKAELAREEAAVFFDRPFQDRAQERFRFRSNIWRQARPALERLFHGKCAYCETLVAPTYAGDVGHFRPPMQRTGDGYWWLAYEWENLLLLCQRCNQAQGMEFPVGKERARPGTVGHALQAEQPLLIDPTIDSPEKFLAFTDEGLVVPRHTRGEYSIRVFDLNRPRLLEERRDTLRRLEILFARTVGEDFSSLPDRLSLHLADEAPHTACARQYVARLLQSLWQDSEPLGG